MKNLMTAVVTALFALSAGVAFAAEPTQKEAAAAKAAASAPVKNAEKAASKPAEKTEKAEPMKKKDKKGGC
jgi:hypothetical protein